MKHIQPHWLVSIAGVYSAPCHCYQLREPLALRTNTLEDWGTEGIKYLGFFLILGDAVSSCLPSNDEYRFSLSLLLRLIQTLLIIIFHSSEWWSSSWPFAFLIFFLHDVMTSLYTSWEITEIHFVMCEERVSGPWVLLKTEILFLEYSALMFWWSHSITWVKISWERKCKEQHCV